MVLKGKTLTRRPWQVITHGEVGVKRPLGRRFGRPWLPRHWKPKDDADFFAAMREELRLLMATNTSPYDPYAGYTIIW